MGGKRAAETRNVPGPYPLYWKADMAYSGNRAIFAGVGYMPLSMPRLYPAARRTSHLSTTGLGVKTFSCGHKKTVANTTVRRNDRGTWQTCRECYNSYARKYQKQYRKLLKKAS